MFKHDNLLLSAIRIIATEGVANEQQIADALGISIDEAGKKLDMLVSLGVLKREEIQQSGQATEIEVDFLRQKVANLEKTLALANAALRAGSQLINELSEGDECTAYMVSVDGSDAPRVVHATVEAAREEAERIAAHRRNATIRILAVVDVLHVQTTETKSLDWERVPVEASCSEACDGACEGCPNA